MDIWAMLDFQVIIPNGENAGGINIQLGASPDFVVVLFLLMLVLLYAYIVRSVFVKGEK